MKEFYLKLSIFKSIFFVIVFITILLFSCSPTKYVPKEEFFLQNYEVKTDNKSVLDFGLDSYVKQKPNKKIFGFYPYARIYNLIDPVKEEKRESGRQPKEEKLNRRRLSKGKEPKEKFYWSRWIRKIGEEPVLYNAVQTRKTSSQLVVLLKSKGYYLAQAFDSVAYKEKRAFVTYTIKSGNPYKIREFKDSITDKEIKSIISPHLKKSKITKGEILESSLLDDERNKITEILLNKGYYKFSKEYIYFSIDTFIGNYQADILLTIKNPTEVLPDGEVEETNHSKYAFDNLTIYPDYLPSNIISKEKRITLYDTIKYDNKISFLIENKNKYSQSVLTRGLRINSDSLYKLNLVKSSFKYYSSLANFRLINIDFTESERFTDTASYQIRYLDTHIKLTPSTPQSFTVELEGNTTSGKYGMASNFYYQNLNIFGGAEILNVKFKVELNNQDATISNSDNYFSETEYGITASLHFPNLISPFNTRDLYLRVFPKTSFSIGYNFRNNINYRKNIFSTTFGYDWRTKNLTHQFDLLEFNSVNLTNISLEYLSDLVNTNQFKEKYDHVIIGSSYSLTYNNQDIKKKRDFIYLRSKLEIAGNILTQLNKSTNADKLGAGEYFRSVYYSLDTNISPVLKEESVNAQVEELNSTRPGFYTLNSIPYAQFAKVELDFRYYQILNSNNQIVYRINPGLIIPYGNSYYSPQEKQFFLGGASSMRAWQSRTLGPGTFKDSLQVYQYGDIKLEMNLEYRFHMFWMIEGAVFADVGNIWTIDNYDDNENKKFSFSDFYKELAFGTGVGLRIDLSFFIFRFDFGFKMYDPVIEDKSKWLGTDAFEWSNTTFNFGIGYPF
ncbi:MAG: BamA/TamA family outer membrane protein [Bacteroidales bacterium]|nr:BamA/TamA family outer membrane protein [Bacteroidales bacterium]